MSEADTSLCEGMDIQVHTVYSNLSVSDTRLAEIKMETEKETQLYVFKQVVKEGWPEERRKCPQSISDDHSNFTTPRNAFTYSHRPHGNGKIITTSS